MAGFMITVDKTQLLEALRENREKHKEAYALAIKGYLIGQKRELEEMLAQVEAGEPVNRHLSHNPPDDHTDSYDEAIEMLEWATEQTLEMTQSQFAQYVRDDWGWKGNWSVSNEAYIAVASA